MKADFAHASLSLSSSCELGMKAGCAHTALSLSTDSESVVLSANFGSGHVVLLLSIESGHATCSLCGSVQGMMLIAFAFAFSLLRLGVAVGHVVDCCVGDVVVLMAIADLCCLRPICIRASFELVLLLSSARYMSLGPSLNVRSGHAISALSSSGRWGVGAGSAHGVVVLPSVSVLMLSLLVVALGLS